MENRILKNNFWGATLRITLNAAVFLMAAAICFALFSSCSEDEFTEKNEEYSIKVGQSKNWTPFSGETNVNFTNANNSVLFIAPSGSTVTFTGLKGGNSIITAASGDKKATAMVTVEDDGGGENNPGVPTDPLPPIPTDPVKNKKIITNAYYAGTLTKKYSYTTENASIKAEEIIDFILKMDFEIELEIWQLALGGKTFDQNMWIPIANGRYSNLYDAYISAKYYYHSTDNNSFMTINGSVECTNSENLAAMCVFYNKSQDKYRMFILGGYSGIACPYKGTKNIDGKIEPWSDYVGFNLANIYYDNNFDNDGDEAIDNDLFIDLEKSDVEGLWNVSQNNEWSIKFQASGGEDSHTTHIKGDVVVGK